MAEWIGTGTKPDDQCTTASECESLVFKFCGIDNLCHQRIWKGTQTKPDNECISSGNCFSSSEDDTSSSKSGTYKTCKKSSWAWLTGNTTLYCKTATWTGENPGDECSVLDEICSEGVGAF